MAAENGFVCKGWWVGRKQEKGKAMAARQRKEAYMREGDPGEKEMPLQILESPLFVVYKKHP